MRDITTLRTAASVAATLICASALAQPVIPGAAGFGMHTPAGRGGKIHRVTNLNDDGAGSLRACVQASGPRVCVFEVSGAIRLATDLTISSPNITIAGQTAPAPGILLRGATLVIEASDVLVQHLAIRVGDAADGPSPVARDSVKIAGNDPVRNVVLDHCSISWAVDENISAFNDVANLTVSNSIIAEPLHDSLHPKGPHGLNALIDINNDTSKVSIIRNLFAHGHGRNPWSSTAGFAFVNNVVYNARDSEMLLTNRNGITSKNSIVGNVFMKGVNASDAVLPVRLVGADGSELLAGTKLYLDDNATYIASSDPWAIVHNKSSLSRGVLEAFSAPSWPDGLKVLSTGSDGVLEDVLKNAGSRPTQRSGADSRIVATVKNGTGQIINCVANDGTSRCSKNAGGWPKLAHNVRRLDLPSSPHEDDDGDGYTNLEEWLHGMAAEVEGRSYDAPPPPDPDAPSEPAEASPPNPPTLRD